MNTVLIILVLSALLALFLARLEANHRRSSSDAWTVPPGSDLHLDHELDRLGAELSALSAHRPSQPVAEAPVRRRPRGHRPSHGVARAA